MSQSTRTTKDFARSEADRAQSDAAERKNKKKLDKELDRALADSFPASDPPAPAQPIGTEPAGDPRTRP